jgi:hypothetical protein
MMNRLTFFLTFLFAALFVVSGNAQQTQSQPMPTLKMDKKSDQLLRSMSNLLGAAKSFTFNTKEMHDRVRPTGKIVQVSVQRKVAVRRPDGIWMHAVTQASDQSRELGLWYDGKTVTLQSDKEKVYARTKVPPTIDEALDYMGSELNLPTPMGDVLYSSVYDSFTSPDTLGKYVKLDKVEGKPCHELAFQNSVLDWQMWIADGPQPLLCKLDIKYKLDHGAPKISMTFLDWNLAAQIPGTQFAHQPPADYRKIQIIGRVPMDQTQTKEN